MSKQKLDKYTNLIEHCKCDKEKAQLYVERAKTHQSMGSMPLAINDFSSAIKLDKDNIEAKSYLEHINEILDYRYMLFYDV